MSDFMQKYNFLLSKIAEIKINLYFYTREIFKYRQFKRI